METCDYCEKELKDHTFCLTVTSPGDDPLKEFEFYTFCSWRCAAKYTGTRFAEQKRFLVEPAI